MVIDTDHFKVVNDTYSHHARVAVLRHNAADIAAASHAMDFVARFSSKKIRDVAAEHQFVFAELVAQSLITSVATQVVEIGKKLVRYTVIAVMALMDSDLSGSDCLMQRADQHSTWQSQMGAFAWCDGPTSSKLPPS